jgi:anti-sigma factor RsiW
MTTENQRDRLWAYVHGELPPDDRQRLEDDLAASPALRAEVAELRAFDRLLRRSLAQPAVTDEELGGRILEAWEADQRPANAGRRVIPFFRSAPFRLGLALAACLGILLGGYQLQAPQHLRWAPLTIAAPAYRGAPAAPAVPAYPAARLEALAAALRREVNAAYRAQPRPATGARVRWTLQIEFQELFAGALAVRVHGETSSGVSARRDWSAEFGDENEFRKRLSAWSRELAEGLATESTP